MLEGNIIEQKVPLGGDVWNRDLKEKGKLRRPGWRRAESFTSSLHQVHRGVRLLLSVLSEVCPFLVLWTRSPPSRQEDGMRMPSSSAFSLFAASFPPACGAQQISPAIEKNPPLMPRPAPVTTPSPFPSQPHFWRSHMCTRCLLVLCPHPRSDPLQAGFHPSRCTETVLSRSPAKSILHSRILKPANDVATRSSRPVSAPVFPASCKDVCGCPVGNPPPAPSRPSH